MSNPDAPTMDSALTTGVFEGQGIAASILDSIPCGVMVLDRSRRIRHLNEAFRAALGIEDAAGIGGCQGAVLGCLHAAEGGHHETPPEDCQACGFTSLATKALDGGQRVRGRVTLQVAADGRLRDLALGCTALPITVADERLVVMLIENTGELHGLRPGGIDGSTFGMIGRHPSMLELYEFIPKIGPLGVPVLIHGETGTGKELVAQALHRAGPRSRGLLVPVNCGALSDGLLESELFGHVRGAFTGALRDKKGRFELADGGTIFLDEIGEMSPAMQVRFLRVLQDGSFEPVGGERTITVDARVVCATHRDLEAEVARGRFRADLYYRLCVVPIRVPPLRERAEDIPLLARHFLARNSRENPTFDTSLSDEALAALFAHRWPGNVRELENAIRYAAIHARGARIECRHLPPGVTRPDAARAPGRPRSPLDAETVREALAECGGSRVLAADRLGVSRTTLWRFLNAKPGSPLPD